MNLKNWRVCEDCEGLGSSLDCKPGMMMRTACRTCCGLGGWENHSATPEFPQKPKPKK